MLVSGPTGVGKSTLLGVVTGLVPRFTGGTLDGDVLLDGDSIVHRRRASGRTRSGTSGRTRPPASSPTRSRRSSPTAWSSSGCRRQTMRRRVEETLDLLGIADLRARDLRTLSGGQQQRVAIGSVLTMHPRLLVLDEPTSALDPTAAEEVLATLTRLVHDLGVTVLLAEHRLERVVPFADRMCCSTGDGGAAGGRARRRCWPPRRWCRRSSSSAGSPGWTPLPLSRARRAAPGPRGAADRPAPPPAPRGASATACSPPPGSAWSPRPARSPSASVDLTVRAGRVTRADGPQRLRASRRCCGRSRAAGRATAGRVDVAGADPAGLDPPTAPGAGRAGAAERRRPALPRDRRRGVRGRRRRRRGAAGTCRELLDRLVPGIPGDRHPRDLSEGQRLALVLALVLAARPRRGAARRADPRPRLRRQARARRRSCAASPRTAHAVLVATHDVEFVAAGRRRGRGARRRRGRLVRAGAPGGRRVAGVRAAGRQGARAAVAAGRRGRSATAERRHEHRDAPSAIAPRSAAGARRRLGRRADDAVLAAAAPGARRAPGSTRRSCSWRCCRS